jgi:glyoxylase-like metal-dependent hydrolase (beta-lactamase superfamily II)
LKRYDVPAYISQHEAVFYKPRHKNLVEIENGEILKIGGIGFKTILTPGHTPGCQCFHYENILITGDTLFINGCGRCDLPGGDARKMYDSLYNILMKLPDDTILFPGHNYGDVPCATVGQQKQTNPYLNSSSKEEFLIQRMGMIV